jgi:hypothetical protein
MSNNKNKKRVYSKPVVEKPVEETIEDQVEEVTEAKAIDPEVFETKLFVEEQPEEVIFSAPVPNELGEVTELPVEEIKIEPHVEGEKLAEVLEKYHNVDAVAELEKVLQSEGADQLGVDAEVELKEKLEEVNSKIEEFQTIQVEPIVPEVEPEEMYTLTPEQEEEGAKAVADMVDAQILEELKALAPEEKIHGEYFFTEKQAHNEVKALSPEPLKDKELDTLSNAELRHFRRTGQMPK